jgi:hypothetical protein
VNADVIDYIRQNRDTYTREAINEKLLAAGYSPGDIDESWELVESGAAPAPAPGEPKPSAGKGELPPPPHSGDGLAGNPLFWSALLGLVVLSYGIPAAIVYLFADDSGPQTDVFTAVWVTFVALQLAALVGWLLLRNRNRPLAIGLLLGLVATLVGLPFAALFVFMGLCFGGYVF